MDLVTAALTHGLQDLTDITIGREVYSVSVAPFPAENYANLYGRNITDRKAAENALQRSEALHRAISRNIPNGAVWVIDHNLRYLVCEGELTNQLGYHRGEVEGRTIEEVLEPELRPSGERIR